MCRTSKSANCDQERQHDRADSQCQALLSSSDAHFILLICQTQDSEHEQIPSWQAPLAQTLDCPFKPLIAITRTFPV